MYGVSSAEDEFFTFWKSLGPKPHTTLRCFERGEIMTLHDTDAVLVAKDYFKNPSLVKRYSKGKSSLSLRSLCTNIKELNGQIQVYLAFCHKEGRKFLVGEFVDSVHLANLETALVQLEARECLIPVGLVSHPDNSKNKTL
ncbi:unnamed protein product [Heterobilharzia americana]|nr:unnamed protein product [Heterobilharzia americana]